MSFHRPLRDRRQLPQHRIGRCTQHTLGGKHTDHPDERRFGDPDATGRIFRSYGSALGAEFVGRNGLSAAGSGAQIRDGVVKSICHIAGFLLVKRGHREPNPRRGTNPEAAPDAHAESSLLHRPHGG